MFCFFKESTDDELLTDNKHTRNTFLSKKTIYLLIRIYKAVAEVTECHSGSEKGSLVHKTELPNHNITLIENVRETKYKWYKLAWNAYRTNDQSFKI